MKHSFLFLLLLFVMASPTFGQVNIQVGDTVTIQTDGPAKSNHLKTE